MTAKTDRRSAPAFAVIAYKFVHRFRHASRKFANPVIECARAAIASLLIFCMLPLGVPDLYAQEAPPPARPAYAQLDYAQLDQLIALIALYPDAMVTQILAAATYSPQIVEADRFVQKSAGMPPQELAHMVNTQPWDPSVKALTAFPSVLSDLDRNLDWTSRLGDAYCRVSV